jgi:hypothetical protein
MCCWCELAFASLCLSASLHRRDGPFWALADGNEMLAPFGLHLVPVPPDFERDGRYVVHLNQHFVAAFVSGGHVLVYDRNQTTDLLW